MSDEEIKLPAFAHDAPWRVRPLLLVMVDMRDWLFQFAAINLLWFVLSLTIIFLPPATLALYYVARHTYYNQEPSIRLYLQGMKSYFWLSYIWAFFMLLILIIGGGALIFYVREQLFFGIVLCVAVISLSLAALFHYLPYLILEKHPLRALKLSVFTALADPKIILLYALLILIFGVPATIMIAPLMFILPITMALIGMYNLLNLLYNYERIDGQVRKI